MVELKWPMTKCEACGYDLREATPKANEKGNDANGKLIWNDFCPKCGHGYEVGARVLPKLTAEALAEQEAEPVISYVEDIKTKSKPGANVKATPPDEVAKATADENPDPENQLGATSDLASEAKPEPGAIRPPGPGQFFCTKCASNHKETSKKGRGHKKYREA